MPGRVARRAHHKGVSIMSQTATSVWTCECPECGAAVSLTRRPLAGEVVRCADCGAELEVVSVDPPRLALAPQVQEDWGE